MLHKRIAMQTEGNFVSRKSFLDIVEMCCVLRNTLLHNCSVGDDGVNVAAHLRDFEFVCFAKGVIHPIGTTIQFILPPLW